MEARYFTDKGIEKFEEVLVSLKETKKFIIPDFNSEPFSKEFEYDIEIDENKIFDSRMDIGKYLYEKIDGEGIINVKILENNIGFWSWLSYIWIRNFCEFGNNGEIKKIQDSVRFIYNRSWRRYYRHFVAFPYYFYKMHGEENSMLFLHKKPYVGGDITESFVSSQDILVSKPVIEAISTLYWDKKNKKQKNGITSKNKPGTNRRLKKVLNQFKLNYDLNNTKSGDIIDLLPKEFDRFIVK